MTTGQFTQTRSIASKMKATVSVIAFFLLLQAGAMYLVSSVLFDYLKNLHEITITADVSRQAREILYSIGETLEADEKTRTRDLIASRDVLVRAAERELELIREAQRDISFDDDTENSLRAAEGSAKQLLETLRQLNRDPKESESVRLIANQFSLEALESLRKVQIRLTDRSERVFATVKASRDFPSLVSASLAVVLFVAALTLGWRFASRLRRSLSALVLTAKEITAGDMTARAPIYDQDEIGYLADTFNNMTTALESRTISRDYVVAIIESMLDAVIVFDERATIIRVNEVSSKLFEYDISELQGSPISTLFSGESASPREVENKETVARTKSGRLIPVEISITSIQGGNDSVHYVCVIRDITSRKRAEREIEMRTIELEASNRELEAFSYSVSHDLRAPLRAIDGFSHALLEESGDKLDEQGKKDLGRVRAASQTMGRLIDDILNLSRLSRAEMKKVDVDLSEIASSIAHALKEGEPSRDVEFVIEPGLHADADPALVRIALDNLIGNAWKYTSKHPKAKIEVGVSKKTDGKQTFFVKDDGAGFDPAFASRLFGAFQRLHSAKDFPGTGIGLATVQRIVRRHGGTLWAEGAIEKGSTFYFTL